MRSAAQLPLSVCRSWWCEVCRGVQAGVIWKTGSFHRSRAILQRDCGLDGGGEELDKVQVCAHRSFRHPRLVFVVSRNCRSLREQRLIQRRAADPPSIEETGVETFKSQLRCSVASAKVPTVIKQVDFQSLRNLIVTSIYLW